jgi:putative zinc finger protein
MSRICPSEELLSAYIYQLLSPEETQNIEKHLISCNNCRELITEVYDIIKKPKTIVFAHKFLSYVGTNKWLLGTIVSFFLSIIFSSYFLQFLTASFIMGTKWIIDSKTTKTLITIHKAIKDSDKEQTEKKYSQFRE